jgi:hypothetical protein
MMIVFVVSEDWTVPYEESSTVAGVCATEESCQKLIAELESTNEYPYVEYSWEEWELL